MKLTRSAVWIRLWSAGLLVAIAVIGGRFVYDVWGKETCIRLDSITRHPEAIFPEDLPEEELRTSAGQRLLIGTSAFLILERNSRSFTSYCGQDAWGSALVLQQASEDQLLGGAAVQWLEAGQWSPSSGLPIASSHLRASDMMAMIREQMIQRRSMLLVRESVLAFGILAVLLAVGFTATCLGRRRAEASEAN